MKILYATMQFGLGYHQGTERYVTMLSEGMTQRGHGVAILAGDPERRGAKRPLGEIVQETPRVLAYPSRGWMSVQGVSPCELVPLLEREAPDLVHVANPGHIGVGLLQAARQLGIPTVVTIMDFWWLCPKHTLLRESGTVCDAHVTWRTCLHCMAASDSRGWVQTTASLPVLRKVLLPAMYFGKNLARTPIHEMKRWTRRQTYLIDELNGADAVIYPSQGAAEILRSHLKPHRDHHIPYGLEPRWFEQQRKDIERESGASQPVIGYAGALAGHKGVHLILEAMHECNWPEATVRIAGTGSDSNYIQRLHQLAKGQKVRFEGRITTEQMPAFLAGLDLLIMPSLWPENLPIVVLEAQAVGTPVIASRIAGITEAVPSAMQFEPGSASALAACLIAFRQRWQAEGGSLNHESVPLQPVSTADEMATRTMMVYEQLIAVK